MATNQKGNDTNLRIIANDIGYIKDDIKEIKYSISSNYVTKDQFEPIKKIVYGLVSLILVAVVGALVSLVVQS